MIEAALTLAAEFHKDQKDKSGRPYILHPLYVMGCMETEEEKVVAILHDVLEDTELRVEDLEPLFDSSVIQGITILTHSPQEPYFMYINRILTSGNMTAIKVKLADLKHNCKLGRLPEVTDKDIKRVEKYNKAIRLLWNALSSEDKIWFDEAGTCNQ